MVSERVTKEECIVFLESCDVFADLDDFTKDNLARISSFRKFKREEIIFLQNEEARGFYLIIEGKIKVFRNSSEGREQILHLLSKGELCGEVPVFQGRNYPASALSVEDLEALYFPKRDFFALGNEKPQVLIGMLAVLSKRLRGFVNLIDDLSLKEVSARLAKYICDLRSLQKTDRVNLDISKSMLASKIGTISETLSRTLKKMSARNIIKTEGKYIEILNQEALRELAAGLKL